MNVLFIQTGGTIDKDYRSGAGVYNFEIMVPAANRILRRASPSFDYRVISVLAKDSQDITQEDREIIVTACRQVPENHIVITHGTDTMKLTAEVLKDITGKVIVLTGSSRPERFSTSDADFNLGMAVGGLSTLQSGVYIAMSGRVVAWDQIHKDPVTGQFIPD